MDCESMVENLIIGIIIAMVNTFLGSGILKKGNLVGLITFFEVLAVLLLK